MLHQIKLLIILMYLPKQSHSPQKLRYNLIDWILNIEYCFPNLEFKKKWKHSELSIHCIAFPISNEKGSFDTRIYQEDTKLFFNSVMKHPYNFMFLASNLPWMNFFLGHVGINNNDG